MMVEPTKNRGGRPAKEGGPTRTRSMRLGPVYDQAKTLAEQRGETITAVIERKLAEYLSEDSPERVMNKVTTQDVRAHIQAHMPPVDGLPNWAAERVREVHVYSYISPAYREMDILIGSPASGGRVLRYAFQVDGVPLHERQVRMRTFQVDAYAHGRGDDDQFWDHWTNVCGSSDPADLAATVARLTE